MRSTLEGILARALQVPFSALAASRLEPVTVAVLDSGIDGSHPELAGRILSAVSFTTDAEDKVAIHALDPASNNDPYNHGTAIASIIKRIAPNAHLIDLKVLGGQVGSPEALMAGIDYANGSPAQMMNISVAIGPAYAPRLLPLADSAYRRGKIVVAATRNRPIEDEGYPASLVHTIGVGNAGRGSYEHWRYRRDIIEFMGHGTDVSVAAAGGGYTRQTGTSFVTPVIAGMVALMLRAHPGLAPFEVKALLKAFAKEAAS